MSSSTDRLLIIVIAVLLPPLAVLLEFGISKKFWISLILSFFFFVPGVIYSLYVVLEE
ncbi:MAG: YqaE/Pmp3 family membrane protein [Eudoraea sp.]|nr:YqaE/Pmp3 family membrane protein [Eudoraea sp.]